jgi:diguanylate cyclase (GGDEF)-like protein/PAS domain S-box-containing protein
MNDTFHRTLQRQMARSGISDEDLSDQRIIDLLGRVSAAYEDADKQRYLHDRAFLLASSEMQNLYDRLQSSSQNEAAVQRDRLKAIFDTAATGLIVLEADGRVFDLNPVAEAALGLDHDAMLGVSLEEILTPADPTNPVIEELRSALVDGRHWRTADTVLMTPNRTTLSVSMLFRAMRTGGGVLAIEDISERKQAQAELIWRANHDSLTGLLNRAALIDRLNRALQRSRRYGSQVAVFYIDLDRFKRVNDTLGHAAGDTLLVECARRISSIMREVDTTARLGGDEFVAIAEHITSTEDAIRIAKRIADTVGQPFTIEDELAYVEASIGVAITDGQSAEPGTVLREADIALYEAKDRNGAAVVLYTESMIRRMQYGVDIERRLRHAMYTDQLWVAFQPIFSLSEETIVGFEALARWDSDEGPVAPEEFIAVAESAGLLEELGRRLIPQALAFQRQLPPEIDLYINMSPGQIAAEGVIEWFDDAIASAGADPRKLIIEVTETDAISDHAITQRLQDLRERGIRIALDDFGVGHSSLSALRALPLDVLKVDRSFLVVAHDDERAESIARMIVDLGRLLAAGVVAEGIETPEQLQLLQEIGCPMGQGFLLGPPEPAAEALARVR